MLKYELKSLDGVAETLRSFYKEQDGVFRLQVDGIDDAGELKRALDRVRTEKNDLKTELSDMKGKFEESETKLQEALASKAGDADQIESLRKSYDEKFERLEQEKNDAIGGKDKFIQKTLKTSKAMEMASELAVDGASKVLMPHIDARLSVEQSGDEYKTVVLGADGKPSAATLDDLKKEFASDEAFAHVIKGSSASGGGAGGGGQGGGASKTGDFGGNRDERKAAIGAQFPELEN